jgi:hypothetical protein
VVLSLLPLPSHPAEHHSLPHWHSAASPWCGKVLASEVGEGCGQYSEYWPPNYLRNDATVADDGGLANDHTHSMVDKNTLTDFGSRVDVNAG